MYTVKKVLVLNATSYYTNGLNFENGFKMPHGQEGENAAINYCVLMQAYQYGGNTEWWVRSWYIDETNIYFPICAEITPVLADFPGSISVEFGIQEVVDLSL